MKIIIPGNIRKVMDGLARRGFEAYIAGGCVRDSLMGMTPHDHDITTDATPGQVHECFPDMTIIDTGIKHGTVTVVSDGENVEITTFRTDGTYSDHRRPDSVSFSRSLGDDLARRDFTVNAMVYSDSTGIVDIYGGRDDISRRVIKCVGDPAERFNEDALRMLRALRFASRLGFSIEENTARAIHEMKGLLVNVSEERIFSELTKMLCGDGAADIMTAFPDVFAQVIPEISAVTSDAAAWKMTAERIRSGGKEPAVLFALLLCGADSPAEDILRRLKADRNTFRTAGILSAQIPAEGHITLSAERIPARKLINALGERNAVLFTYAAESTALADNDRADAALAAETRAVINDIITAGECCSLEKLAFSGDDAICAGFRGKKIKALLEKLLADVIEEKLPNDREELFEAALSYKDTV